MHFYTIQSPGGQQEAQQFYSVVSGTSYFIDIVAEVSDVADHRQLEPLFSVLDHDTLRQAKSMTNMDANVEGLFCGL